LIANDYAGGHEAMQDAQHASLNLGLTELIRHIYDAALDARRWPQVLAYCCVEFSSQAALIFGYNFEDGSAEVTGGTSMLAAHHGLDDSAITALAAHYSSTNVWLQDELLHREGMVVNSSHLYPDRHLMRTEWGDWLGRMDKFHSFAAVVEKRAQRSFNLSMLRSRRCGTYSASEEERLATLMPHLQTAFALHRRLHRAEALANASLTVLDGLPMGVVLLGDGAQVMHANVSAHQLANTTGLLYFGADDRLHVQSVQEELQLQQAMNRAVATGGGLVAGAGNAIRLHALDGSLLHILVTPLPQRSKPFGQHAAGAVFISNPKTSIQSLTRALQGLYRMTQAEARLTEALVNGLSLQEYAAQRELSMHTVRSQYKAAAAKVGQGRQADFVRLVLTGPAIFQRLA
jgi:DNA-binding CsgD family transcriptional regulator